MKIIATNNTKEIIISISDVNTIQHDDNAYYITGKYDAKSLAKELLTIRVNGTVLFKVHNIEVDIEQFDKIEVVHDSYAI